MKKYSGQTALKTFLIISLALNVIAAFFAAKYLYREYRHGAKYVTAAQKKDICILILGDSRASGGDFSNGLKRNDVYNAGISGIATGGLLEKMDDIINGCKPKLCFIQVGVNDIRSKISVDSTEKNYERILQKLTAQNILPVVTSIIPLRKDFWQDDVSETVVNEKVDSLNTMLHSYCSNNKIDYVDVNSTITENKRLKRDYTADGIHLNANGYYEMYRKMEDYLAIKKISCK